MPGSVFKAQLRRRIWDRLIREGLVRMPGAYGLIPRVTGIERAALRLRDTEEWKSAHRVLVFRDEVLREIRSAALHNGKTLVVPDLSLARNGWLIEIHPEGASTHLEELEALVGPGTGALKSGSPPGARLMRGRELERVDLVVTGAVGVNAQGAMVGRGDGEADIVYALGRDRGFVGAETPVAVVVHDSQIFDDPVDPEPTDLPVDVIVTPTRTIAVRSLVMRPKGLHPSLITPERLEMFAQLRSILEREGFSVPPSGPGAASQSSPRSHDEDLPGPRPNP